MHHAVAAETIYEEESFHIRRRSDDGMMIRGHFIKSRPRASRVDAGLSQNRHARSRMRENLLNKCFIKFGFEAWRFFRIVPGEENSLAFAAKVKTGGHVYHHRKTLR